MNEPAVFNDMKTMEPDVMHRNNGRPMTHDRLHNLYGLMTRATYEGMRKLLGDERPFVLTRARDTQVSGVTAPCGRGTTAVSGNIWRWRSDGPKYGIVGDSFC